MLNVTITDDHNAPIKLSEMQELIQGTGMDEAAPSSQTTVTASGIYEEESVNVTGTTASYMNIQGLTLADGRFLMRPDIDNHSNVAVVSAETATDLLGRSNVVGETIKLNGKEFLIIGVLEEEETAVSSMTDSYAAYIPYTALIRLTEGVSMNVTSFCVSVNGEDMDAAEEELETILMKRFGQDEDAFSIFNQSAVAEAMSSVTGTLSLLLGGIAAISLLVGGIGIMNIMLVSVTERTREIGIRKAIGAGRGTIMTQFLTEALMVSLSGCFLGIIFSWFVIIMIDLAGGVEYGLSGGVVLVSVVFSVAIGVIFGIYPANKAAKMKPVDALRFN